MLDHRGARYTYRKVPMILRPFQQPHPPLWYGLSHAAGAEWSATNKVNALANGPSEVSAPLFDRYREVWERKHGGGVMPKLGITRHVVTAPTDAQAEALARPSYATWYANLTKLWRDFGSIPIRFARDFDEARQRGVAIAGTPARVREEIEAGRRHNLLRLPADVRRDGSCRSRVSIDLFASSPAAARRVGSPRGWPVTARACVLEFGMGVDVHGRD